MLAANRQPPASDIVGRLFPGHLLWAIAFCLVLVSDQAKAQPQATEGADLLSSDKTSHHELSCSDCHPQTLLKAFQRLQKELNLQLDPGHDRVRERIKLVESDLLLLQARCRECHRDQYDQWQRSGHAVTYSQVFLNRRHNKLQQLNDDCLRCHGLFFDGTIHDLVTPVNTRGPWRLVDPKRSDKSAIPCMSCHQIHPRQHTVVSSQSTPARLMIEDAGKSPSGFYDRREKHFFSAGQLPTPRIWVDDGALEVASDEPMRVCYQCHAPTVTHRAGSGDDRTLRGVHAKLSCFDCHQDHALSAHASCANCHPANSNCGLDVRRMDTTYNAKASSHDIHSVRCQDCHPNGVPDNRGKGD